MLTVIAGLVLFGVLITVHELGHFLMAKATGMQVDEFAIGFGPLLVQKKIGDTLYSLRLFPLGGYNKIAGMEPGEVCGPRGFNNKPLLSRMLVILAGPFMNFVLPFLIFFLLFAVSGVDRPLDTPVAGSLMANYPAAQAGLKPGDRIVSINGKAMVKWTDIGDTIRERGESQSSLVVNRNGKTYTFSIIPKREKETKRLLLGIRPPVEHQDLTLAQSVKAAALSIERITAGMLQGLKLIITRKAPAELSGPIGVAQMAGDVASQGAVPYLGFMAFLSLNLAVLNLLPIPALDGGQFLVLLLEGIIGHALPPRAKLAIQWVGIACILSLTVFATMQDLIR